MRRNQMKNSRNGGLARVAVGIAACAVAAIVMAGCPGGGGNGPLETRVDDVQIVRNEADPGLVGAEHGGQANFVMTLVGQGGSISLTNRADFQVRFADPEDGLVGAVVALPGTVGFDSPGDLRLAIDWPWAGETLQIIVSVREIDVPIEVEVVEAPELTGWVGISGTPATGRTITAFLDDLDVANAPAVVWERGFYPNFSHISDAPFGADYAVRTADLGQTLRAVVTVPGYSGVVYSAPSLPVTGGDLPPLGGTVTLTMDSDELSQGTVLTANASGLLPASDAQPSFFWQRRSESAGEGAPFETIVGATGAQYTVRSADVRHEMRVAVMRVGNSGYVASGVSASVPSRTVAEQIDLLLAMNPPPATAEIVAWDAEEALSPRTLAFDGNPSVRIHLSGSRPDNIIWLDGMGSMLTVGSGVTLVLENVTLGGQAASEIINNRALVTVASGGTLEMEDGAWITENANPAGNQNTHGGGVHVGVNATFVMRGGRIFHNAGAMGGGVFTRGSLVMEGGQIANNASGQGGGVAVIEGGSFEMNGGIIEENSAQVSGGGVATFPNSTFVMREGAAMLYNFAENPVNANAGADGGGAVIRGTFVMHAGALIAGNRATQYGGGVMVLHGGRFTMGANAEGEEATISFNEAVFGGGVFNFGTFEMFGGRIFENEAFSAGAFGPGQGGGVLNVNDAFFDMHNGHIQLNRATLRGGGLHNQGHFRMAGGSIGGREDPELGNMTVAENGVGAALSTVGATATAAHGAFEDGVFIPHPLGDLPTSDITLWIFMGDLATPTLSITIVDIPPRFVDAGYRMTVQLFTGGEFRSLNPHPGIAVDGDELTIQGFQFISTFWHISRFFLPEGAADGAVPDPEDVFDLEDVLVGGHSILSLWEPE